MAETTANPPANPNLGLLANTGFGDLPTGAQIGMIVDTLKGGNSLWNFMAQSSMAQRQLDYQKNLLLGQPGQVQTPDDPGQDASAPGGAVAPHQFAAMPTGRLTGGLLSNADPMTQQRAMYGIMAGNGQNILNELTAGPKLNPGEIMTPQGAALAPNYANVLRQKAMSEQMGKDYRGLDAQGNIVNLPGAVQAGAQVTGTNELAKANVTQPFELQKIQTQASATGNQNRLTEGYKLGNTPTQVDVAQPDGTVKSMTMSQADAAKGWQGKTSLGPIDAMMQPELIKGIAERQQSAQKASDALADIGEFRKALDGLPTGPGTELVNEAAAGLQKFGLNVNDLLPSTAAADPTKYQIAMKNINKLGMALAASNFPGRITNADLKMATTASPNIMMSPDALKTVTDNIEQAQRLKIERGNFDRRYLFNHGNIPSLAMEDQWQNHVQSLKGINDNIKQSYMGLTQNVQGPNGQVTTQPTNAQADNINLPPSLPDGSTVANFTRNKKTGEVGYQWRKPNGQLYFGDAQGNPH